ncbi:alpha-1A adrenergic receptor-like [Antedon mediterranea]|uniref:alpha-1A adrenergic receptor-like n=1 Tax=Antedon mediterranea TaxID=105859 RepID=UPI003AF8CF80
MTIEAIILVAKFIMTPLAIIGVLANLTVIIVFINCKIHTRSFAYTLVLQQAVIDMLGCCCNVVFSFVNGNTIACRSSVIFYFIIFASSHNLVLISIERYIAVVHPLKYWARGTQKIRLLPRLCIPFVSSLLTCFYLPLVLDVNEFGYCLFKNKIMLISSNVLISISAILLPIVIMLHCYRQVYVTLRQKSRTRAELMTPQRIQQPGSTSPAADSKQLRNKAERNFTSTMFINTLIYIILFSPSMLVNLWILIFQWYKPNLHLIIIAMICNALILCNMVANPFVYAYTFTDYKKGFRKTFRCRNHRMEHVNQTIPMQ